MRTPGGGRGGAVAGSGVEQDRLLTAEDRLRQLEAENLRLRFRVADLEGQVQQACSAPCLALSVFGRKFKFYFVCVYM